MNYCMQLEASWPQDLDDLSFHLARVRANPVPFTAYVRNKHRRLLCSSPERFLLKEGDLLYSQPIKGTLPRGEHALADEKLAFELKNNPKYRAENVMIVDLVRNDLARIAKQGSVEVEELFGVYGFAYVFQMISTIRARIDEDFKWADLLRALFPMGSMTGAPKIAAMQFIEAYEKCSRQWYSGSVFYRNQLGDFDSNVIIRSIYLDTETQKCSYGVGGAITYDSSPEAEYQECVDKLKGILPQP
jgi:para-aminobenzoate synthetase component 1